MATTLKFRRGNKATSDSFTGSQAELFINTEENRLVVHDGSTTGGFPVTKSSELESANTFLQANDAITLSAAHTYTDSANSWLRANDATTLAAAKSYTDTANSYLGGLITSDTTKTQAAFDKANTAYTAASDSYNYTTTVDVYAQAAFAKANTDSSLAQAAFNSGNTTLTYSQSAYSQANAGSILAQAAFDSGNTTLVYAQSSYSKANADGVLAQAAFDAANSAVSGTAADGWARSQANSAFDKANTVASDLATANTFLQANDATTLATAKSYTDTSISNLINSAPAALDTLKELADALADDPNFATTITTSVGQVRNHANGAFDKANTNASDIVVIQSVNTTQNTNISSVSTLAQAAYDSGNTNSTSISTIQAVNTTQNTNITASSTLAQAAFNAGNTTNTYATTGFYKTNVAFTHANTGFAQANAAYNQANTTNTYATTGFYKTNVAFTHANTAFVQANSAYNKANSANSLAQSAFDAANTASNGNYTFSGNNITLLGDSTGNLAVSETASISSPVTYTRNPDGNSDIFHFDYANIDPDAKTITFQTYGGASLITALSSAYTNGATINVAYDGTDLYDVTPGVTQYANIVLTSFTNTSGPTWVGTYNETIPSLTSSSRVYIVSWNAVTTGLANRYYEFGKDSTLSIKKDSNTSSISATSLVIDGTNIPVKLQSAYNLSNTNSALAQAAFNSSNTKFNSSGGTISGDTIINGNVTVTGTTFYANTVNLRVEDNIITLNSNVTGTPTQDSGIEVNRGSSTNTALIWKESAGAWEFTNNGTSYDKIAGLTYANAAFAKANSGTVLAQAAFDSGNTTITYAQSAYAQANYIGSLAVTGASLYDGTGPTGTTTVTNSAGILQVGINGLNGISTAVGTISVGGGTISSLNIDGSYIFNTANAAYSQGNTTLTYAQASYAKANADGVLTQAAFDSGNTTLTYAQASYAKANADGVLAQAAFDSSNSISFTVISGTTAAPIANNSYIVYHGYNGVNVELVEETGAYSLNFDGSTLFNQANSAFDHSNTTLTYAQSAYNKANTVATDLATANTYLKGYTDSAIANLVNSAPTTLDTLNELATALGNDANFATTVSTNIAVARNTANAAFDKANSATTLAQAAYNSGNTTLTYAQAGYSLANTNTGQITVIQAVDTTQNTNITTATNSAQAAFNQANSAYNSGNTTFTYASSGFNQANVAFAQANSAYNTANVGNSFVTGGGYVGGQVTATSLSANTSVTVNTSVNMTSTVLVTSATTANQIADSFSTSTYRSAKYEAQITSGSSYHVIELRVLHDGTTVLLNQYGEMFTGSSLGTFDANISTGTLRLLFTPTNAVTTVKLLRNAIAV